MPGKPLFLCHRDDARWADAVGLLVESTWAGRRRSKAIPTIRPASARRARCIRPRCWSCTTPIARKPCRYLGQLRTWDDAAAAIRADDRKAARPPAGRPCACSPRPSYSPTLAAQLEALLKQCPEAKWHVLRAGQPRCGEPSRAVGVRQHRFCRDTTSRKADVVVSLDADFLASRPGTSSLRRRFHEAPPAPLRCRGGRASRR